MVLILHVQSQRNDGIACRDAGHLYEQSYPTLWHDFHALKALIPITIHLECPIGMPVILRPFSNQIYFAALFKPNLFCGPFQTKFILRPFSNQIYFAVRFS